VRLNLGTKDGGEVDADRLHRSAAGARRTGGRVSLRSEACGSSCMPRPVPTPTTRPTPRWALLAVSSAARTSWRELAHDPAVAEVLGIEAVPSQRPSRGSSRAVGRSAGESLSGHRWAVQELPARRDGYTLDLDSFSLIHEDGHQEGVRVGYTRKGLKPCHRPIVAALAEVPLVAHFWLRPGNTACVSGANIFLGDTLARLPATVRVTLVRADSGFCTQGMITGWNPGACTTSCGGPALAGACPLSA
jgi:hypothetical protein